MRTFAKKPKANQKGASVESSKPSRSFVGQSRDEHSILHLQCTIGNQAVLRLLQTVTENVNSSSVRNPSTGLAHDFSHIPVYTGTRDAIQPKLKVNAPRDQYEQEADRIADQALRHEIPQEEEEQKVDIQTKSSRQTAVDGSEVSEELENGINRSKGSGNPISDELRAFVEPHMQFDFSKVQIHTDNKSAQMNQELGARAFTHGRDIYFGAGQYNPQSIEGKRLLIHELTHTIQQNIGSANRALIQRTLEEDIESLLGRIMPSPNTDENRIAVIEALCTLPIHRDEIQRLAERRILLREVFTLVDSSQESARLQEILRNRLDPLSRAFYLLHTATRNELLEILQIRQATETAPSWDFRDPEEGRGIELNPEFWIVTYQARRGGVWMSATNEGDLSAYQALQRHTDWNGSFDELNFQVEIVGGAAEAIEDAYDQGSVSQYKLECNIAANLVQLRRMYLYYMEQARHQDRAHSEARQAFDRDYNDFNVFIGAERNPANPAEPITTETSFLLGTALEGLRPVRIPIRSGPDFNGLVSPGDWVAIDSADLVRGLFRYENAIYLGNNEFYGLGIQNPLTGEIENPFTAEFYAQHYIMATRPEDRQYTPWPTSLGEILDHMYVKPTGRPRSPAVTF